MLIGVAIGSAVTVLPDGAGARQKGQLDNSLSPASLYRIYREAIRMAVRVAPASFASKAYKCRTKHGNCFVNAIMIASSRPGNEIRRVS